MFKSLAVSWNATKLSLNVIKSEKQLMILPVFSAIFSLFYLIALLLPAFIVFTFVDLTHYKLLEDVITYTLLFLLYLGLSFISTFLNVGVVYITKNYFEGKHSSLKECFKFALSKIHLIFAWSLLSGVVGVALKLIRDFSENLPVVGEIIVQIIVGFLGIGWGIASIFVVPGMVYENLGPWAALKKSVSVLKKTWGENIIKYTACGILNTLFVLIALPVFGVLFLLSSISQYAGVLYLVTFILFVLYIASANIVITLVKSIFNVALYVYATSDVLIEGYSPEIFNQAFIKKK